MWRARRVPAKPKMPSKPAHRHTKAADGQLRQKQIDPEATRGVWRWNDRKVKRNKQGTPSRADESTDLGAAPPRGPRTKAADTAMEVRASIGARKRGNARGAKGRRKSDRERTDNWKKNRT